MRKENTIHEDALKKVLLEITEGAKKEGRDALLDTEGQAVLKAMQLDIPAVLFVKSSSDLQNLQLFSGLKSVIKVVSAEILHKTDVGGVAIIPNTIEAIKKAIETMEAKFKGMKVDGYTINEFIEYDTSIGKELIIGYRNTGDFGPVVSFATGGIFAEFLAKSFKEGLSGAVFSNAVSTRSEIINTLKATAPVKILSGSLRNQKSVLDVEKIADIIEVFLASCESFIECGITELEVNPFVVTGGRLVALDILIKLGSVNKTLFSRPVSKIKAILEPKSAAIIGVSEKMNTGHIILNNLIHDGFDKKNIFIVKPGSGEIEGVTCYPTISDLPKCVDLFILSISAAQTPQAVTEIIEGKKAESVIVIPGGLEEKQGTENLVKGMYESLAKSRNTEWGGPLINGGNCLGIRSVPGKYNTLFIPTYKLPMPSSKVAPVAIVSQSGAYAISRFSRLPWLNPKFMITCGNQMDVTIGDYLEYLKNDTSIKLFAVYVEGFKQNDGLKFLQNAKAITESGRTVLLYRAGRTVAGAKASASHTASIAGDYEVTRSLCEQCGVVLAETFEDFDDLVKLYAMLEDKKAKGFSLGAISNAGCECVAIADNLHDFTLAEFSSSSSVKLEKAFAEAKIQDIVDVHNPIDLTPMAGDEAYAVVTEALLDDESINAAVIGCVPLSAALNTLPLNSSLHGEDLKSEKAFATRMGTIMKKSHKPWVCVVDSGSLYDPLANALEENGVPCFRTAGRALKLLHIFVKSRL